MSKRPKQSLPPNFVDLRQTPGKHHGVPIDDIRRPATLPRPKSLMPLLIGGILVVLIVIGVTLLKPDKKTATPSSPVPTSITKAVSFPVYYPASAKLPAGYRLNHQSFNAAANVVIFTMQTASQQQISFSEQAAPPTAQVATFEQQRLPLHTDVVTSIGTARVGAINNQATVSLLTDKTWLLISAPYQINQVALRQILQSLRR